VIFLIGLVWGNYHFDQYNIWGEDYDIQAISIRSLVTTGNSPFSDLVTTQIQDTVENDNGFVIGNPARYTSPLYSGIVVLPFTLIDNKALSHALWSTAQLVAIFIILLIGLKLTAWKPAWYIFLLFSVLTIFSYHVIVPWLNSGLDIWASLFLIVAFLAIQNNRFEIGGIFLAGAAIQPQMIILLMVYILFWAALTRKRLLIIWFFATLIFLSIVGLFLVPDWIMQYLRILYNYPTNFPPGSPGILFSTAWPGLGKQLGWLVTGISALIIIIEGWLALRKDFRWFLWTACLILVTSQWTGIPTTPGNFSGLILPLILISAMLTEHWPRAGQWVAVFMVLLLFVWEWALFYMDITSSVPKMQLNLLFPLPLILLIGLFWVRWWAIKPKRMLIEEFQLGETH
jgi:hypothetical protein